MVEITFQNTMLSALLANLVGLNFKIIWDVVQKRRNDQKGVCALHKNLEKRLDNASKCQHKIKRDLTVQETTLEERSKTIFERLERGARDFDKIREELKENSAELIRITTTLKERAER